MSNALTTPELKTGDARWFFGMLMIVRATAADTGGAYSLFEVEAPPGLEAPLHVHHGEDEGFHVLEGSVMIEIGGERTTVGAGEFAFGPREIPHRFEVGPEGARMLWVLNPSGFEKLVAEASVPAAELAPPPAEVTPPTDAGEIVARHGNELL